MNRPTPTAPLLLAVLLLLTAVFSNVPASIAGKRYVCPPCAQPCDSRSFDAPGKCPGCGMKLVEAAAEAAKPGSEVHRKVAILVFEGVEILDYTGPYEMFGAAGYDVFLVAATKAPVTTAMGMTVVPSFSFADAPAPDVLVVPGGGVTSASGDAPTLAYVRSATRSTTHTMSVCNGAFILAAAGLLDGLTATTTNHNIARLGREFPKVRVVGDRRFTDNGKIICTAGLAAGIDGALHVIERLDGHGAAQSVALIEEYDWRPDAPYTRALLADREIPELKLEEMGDWRITRTEGDTSRWDIAVRGTPGMPVKELAARIDQALENGHWSRVGAADAEGTSRWSFTGRDGKRWTGALQVRADAGSAGQVDAALTIARAAD